MKRYLMARSLLLTQTWAIVAFAVAESTLTGQLLSGAVGGQAATGLLALVSTLLTVEWAEQLFRGDSRLTPFAGQGYMVVAGLLLVQMFVMSVSGYFGVLFWLYCSLSIHSATLAWILSHFSPASNQWPQNQ